MWLTQSILIFDHQGKYDQSCRPFPLCSVSCCHSAKVIHTSREALAWCFTYLYLWQHSPATGWTGITNWAHRDPQSRRRCVYWLCSASQSCLVWDRRRDHSSPSLLVLFQVTQEIGVSLGWYLRPIYPVFSTLSLWKTVVKFTPKHLLGYLSVPTAVKVY